MNKTLILLIVATAFISQTSSRFVLFSGINVRETADNFVKFLEGFSMGFINEDITDIEKCAFDSTGVVIQFSEIIQKFEVKRKDSIISAYQELLTILQELPPLLSSCSTVQSSVEKLVKKVLQVVDIANFAKNVGVNLAFHSIKIMGELAHGL